MDSRVRVVILGAGLSGLSAAYNLKENYEIFEKEASCGGLCRSRNLDGFTFDIAGHLLHFREKENLDFVRGLLGKNLIEKTRSSWIWFSDRFIRYPFQANLYGLPSDILNDCLTGFKKAQQNPRNGSKSNGKCFNSWILSTFGEGIARHFLIPYNKKFWLSPLENLVAEWARDWLPVPTLREVQKGARQDCRKAHGYNARFWYPKIGGIQALINALERNTRKVHTNYSAVRLDLKNREIIFNNGSKVKFRRLISTIPLPELSPIIVSLPADVKRAFSKLKYVSLFNLNLGLSKRLYANKHWVYYPQREISFYRLGISTNFSRALAPRGCDSVYTEISYSEDQPIDKKNIIKTVIRDFQKAGFDLEVQDIKAVDINDVKYGYCLYDHQRARALRVIQDYLKSCGVSSIGRYGAWRYASMEDTMIEARNTAESILREPW